MKNWVCSYSKLSFSNLNEHAYCRYKLQHILILQWKLHNAIDRSDWFVPLLIPVYDAHGHAFMELLLMDV